MDVFIFDTNLNKETVNTLYQAARPASEMFKAILENKGVGFDVIVFHKFQNLCHPELVAKLCEFYLKHNGVQSKS